MNVDIAIIGAGPAGLAAAMALREEGLFVSVFERESEGGGVPRHCGHPVFGVREFHRPMTGQRYAQALMEQAARRGVGLCLQHTVSQLQENGRFIVGNRDGLAAVEARRVLLATGIRETPRSARLCGGDRPWGVFNTGALQSFVYLQKRLPFKRPVIIGTELVSLSAVWTCRMAGIHPVAVLEGNPRPTVPRLLATFPQLLGIPVQYGCELQAIQGEAGCVSAVSVRDGEGQIRQLACDAVLFTGQFVPEANLVRESHLCLDAGSQGPGIDQAGRCSDPAYFAAGNLLRALETAGWSYREGRRVGKLIARDLAEGKPANGKTVRIVHDSAIKLVVPQRLTLPVSLDELPDLQIRVRQEARGFLTVRGGKKTLWRKAIHALPERRILVPIRLLDPGDADELWVGITTS